MTLMAEHDAGTRADTTTADPISSPKSCFVDCIVLGKARDASNIGSDPVSLLAAWSDESLVGRIDGAGRIRIESGSDQPT